MKLIHELIAGHAAAFPEKTALQDAYGEMSYGELEARSASVSRALSAIGVRQGDTVAVYVPYVKEIVLGAVSALCTGCIFIPFDGEYPEKRLTYMLENSEAVAILTLREFWNEKPLNFPLGRVLFMDEILPATAPAPPAITLTENSPAMLLYTSGTTGQPKGVLHSHRMLLHIVDCLKLYEDTAMTADSRSGVISNFAFVGSQTFLFGPLLFGGTTCIAPEAARKDMGYLYQFLRDAHITHIFIPSGLAAMMMEDYDLTGVSIFAAGEKLRNFHSCTPANFLVNLYGSTEAGGVMTKKIYGDEERILVGQPYQTTRAMIVDSDMHPLGTDEAGDLLITSDYMSSGYYKLPEQSAEKWVTIEGTRWFRTGDRATCNADGNFAILGRTDNMVKLRGFRIETGEVETQIANAISRLGRTDVGQLVVVVKNITGIDHLSCYYESLVDLDRKTVCDEIANYLADYMVPDVWVRMDALPRNQNGKVMRGELPLPKRKYKSVGVIDSEVLFRLLMTTADLLDADEYVGPDEKFTEIGGTSLNAMKLAVALREQGIKISGSQILQYNVLRKIAEKAVVAYEQLWDPETYAAIRRDFASRGEHIEKVLPIAEWQDQMLFRQLIFPDSHDFRNVVFLQVDSILSEEHLREALDVIAREHEELRSAIVFHNITTIQQVITDRKIPLDIIDAEQYNVQSLQQLRESLYNESIDLQYSCLMKMACLRVKEKSFLYVLTNNIAISQAQLRHDMIRLMQVLRNHYPDDISISGWIDMLELGIEITEKGPDDNPTPTYAVPFREARTSEIRVYSENDGPKMVFVHTGNTGSDAYYRLADRIGEKISFAVIEPYNLYHADDVRHGIKAIATNYIRILKEHQPKGPYILGGWCYGGVVAHEMACQLRQAGEEVQHLIMLDSHALADNTLREISKGMLSEVNVEYFETCPLFAELREAGMLEAMVNNAKNVANDLTHHVPSFFDGEVTYFKPNEIPAGVKGDNRKYWEKMMEFEAGNYENFCNQKKLRIIHTPHEHDLMMDDASLAIIVPEIYTDLNIKD